MIIRVTSVEWTWLGLEWPLAYYVALYMGEIVSLVHSCILAVSNFIFYNLQHNGMLICI